MALIGASLLLLGIVVGLLVVLLSTRVLAAGLPAAGVPLPASDEPSWTPARGESDAK